MTAQEASFEMIDSMPYFLKSPNSCAITIDEQSVRAMMPNRILGVSGPSAAYAPPTQPFGIPAVLSLAFWGGVWGILFALVQLAFPRGGRYWGAAFLFGALFPSLVAWLMVLPLKGLPAGSGLHPAVLATAFLINGVWGMGTGLGLRLLAGVPTCGINCGLPVRTQPT